MSPLRYWSVFFGKKLFKIGIRYCCFRALYWLNNACYFIVLFCLLRVLRQSEKEKSTSHSACALTLRLALFHFHPHPHLERRDTEMMTHDQTIVLGIGALQARQIGQTVHDYFIDDIGNLHVVPCGSPDHRHPELMVFELEDIIATYLAGFKIGRQRSSRASRPRTPTGLPRASSVSSRMS